MAGRCPGTRILVGGDEHLVAIADGLHARSVARVGKLVDGAAR